MANQIRIHTSCDIVNDNSVANEGTSAGDYTNLNLDVHADSRTWGGNYNIAQAYDSTTPAVCYWKNAVIDSTGPTIDYLNDSGWTTSANVTDGAIPTTAHVVAVEYVKTLGTVSHVDVTLSGEVIARLTLGESIVIPWHAGEAVGSIGLTPSHAYSAGVTEATVNVMIAGV
jgi:hypothetical protein